MKKFGRRVIGVLLLCAAAANGYAQMLPIIPLDQANPGARPGLRETPRAPQANNAITENRAVEIARQNFAGNILRISLIGEGENQQYQIRMENEGKVFTVFVHAATGRVTGGN